MKTCCLIEETSYLSVPTSAWSFLGEETHTLTCSFPSAIVASPPAGRYYTTIFLYQYFSVYSEFSMGLVSETGSQLCSAGCPYIGEVCCYTLFSPHRCKLCLVCQGWGRPLVCAVQIAPFPRGTMLSGNQPLVDHCQGVRRNN